jgi:hypothetical protein
MRKIEDIIDSISNVSNNLKWKEIEVFCKQKGFPVETSKKGYKVYINNSVWSVHLEHRTSNELKHGIIRELRKILIKENILWQKQN